MVLTPWVERQRECTRVMCDILVAMMFFHSLCAVMACYDIVQSVDCTILPMLIMVWLRVMNVTIVFTIFMMLLSSLSLVRLWDVEYRKFL